MWTNGTITIGSDIIDYQIKYYDEPSEYGINNGRISKLVLIQDGKWVTQYCREWVLKPTTDSAQKALEILMKKYN